MSLSNKRGLLLNILFAYLCTWALQVNMGISVRNPFTVLIFGISFYWLRQMKVWKAIRVNCINSVIALIISAIISKVRFSKVTAGFNSSLFKGLTILVVFAGTFIIAWCAGNYLASAALKRSGKWATKEFFYLKELDRPFSDKEEAKEEGSRINSKAMIAIFAAICFICWLPYYLYEYPGIITADSLVQYEQVVGIRALSNHHPVIHTFCIFVMYQLGMLLLGDASKAMGVYTLSQMVFMAWCCGILVENVRSFWNDKGKRGSGKSFTILSLLFFALVPFNAVFAATVWKDVPFAGLLMLFTCNLYKMIKAYGNGEAPKALLPMYVKFAVLGILLCLFRTNGYIAFILSVPFFIYVFRKQIKSMLITLVVVVFISSLIKGPVMNALHVEQPDFVESLSVPLQQIARVLVEDRKVAESDLSMIDDVIDRTYIHELYAPDFADNIKELVRAGHPEVLEQNKMAYLGLWTRLLFRYPADYLKAWFDLVGGYLYPDVAYEVGNIDGIMENPYGLTSTPLIGGKVVIKAKEIFIKLGSFMPIYGLLWSIGAYTWFLGICLVDFLSREKARKYGTLLIYPLMIVATLCIASPVVDFRYGYGIVMVMPLLASILVYVIIVKKDLAD